MDLLKFKIVSPKDGQSVDNIYETILINLSHIVSVKPINIVIEEKIVKGFWIRTTNGKKYRAVEIPASITKILSENAPDIFDGLNSELSEDGFPSESLLN